MAVPEDQRFVDIFRDVPTQEQQDNTYHTLEHLCRGCLGITQRLLVADKVNLAYNRHAISMEQWGRLYELLNEPRTP